MSGSAIILYTILYTCVQKPACGQGLGHANISEKDVLLGGTSKS